MGKGKFTAATVTNGIYILTESKSFITPGAWELYKETETPSCVAVVQGDREKELPEKVNNENLYFFSKNSGHVYLVKEHPDGTLFISENGKTSIPWAGNFISGCGGIQSVLSRCVKDSRTIKQIRQDLSEQARMGAEREKLQLEGSIQSLKSDDGVIPTSVDSLRLVAKWLLYHSENLAQWRDKPQLDVPYDAIAFAFNEGGTQIRIVTERPVQVEDGTWQRQFVYGKCGLYVKKYYLL